MNNWKEIDLFNYLVENVYPDLVKSKNQMSRWDCYSVSTGHRIELKCRQVHYKTLLLEKVKYDAMIKECEKHLDIPVYINSTPKGIYSFNLHLIEPIWEINNKNPATTYFNNREKNALIDNKMLKLEAESKDKDMDSGSKEKFFRKEMTFYGVDTLKKDTVASNQVLAQLVPHIASGRLHLPQEDMPKIYSLDQAAEAFQQTFVKGGVGLLQISTT